MREKLRSLPLSLIFLLALLLRVAAMIVLSSPAYHLRDIQDHFVFGYEEGRVARSLAQGQGFSSPMPLPTGPTAFVAPLYPLFLALVFKGFGVYTKVSAIVILSFQCIFASATCIFIYFCGRSSVGEMTGKLAALAWAVFPVSIFLTLYRIWDTALSAMLAVALFWCWFATQDSFSLWRWALAGAAVAIAALINPTLIVIAIPFLFLSAWRHRQRITIPALVAGLSCAALASPWLIRNNVQFGAPWLRSNFPLELHLGNSEFSHGQWTESLHPAGPASVSLNEHYRDLGEKRFMEEQGNLTSRFVSTHWRLFAFATLNRFLYYWTGAWLTPTKEYPNRWPLIALTSGLSLLAFLGVHRMISLGNSAGLLYAGCFLLYPLPYYLTYGQVRFYHSIAPLIMLCGAFWVLSFKNGIAVDKTLRVCLQRAAAPDKLRNQENLSGAAWSGSAMNRLSGPDRESFRIAAAYERRKRPDFPVQYSGFDPANLFRIQELEQKIFSALENFGVASLRDKRILEIGCGSGFWLRQFIQWGALPENLSGIDLLAERIANARGLCPAGISLQCGDASRLSLPDESFDLVFQVTVFTSILDRSMKERIAAEMLRVLRLGGLILWYDFFVNNPRNPDVRGIRRHEIRDLFPGCKITCQRVSLAPPLARILRTCPSSFYSALSALKLFDTHYLALIAKAG